MRRIWNLPLPMLLALILGIGGIANAVVWFWPREPQPDPVTLPSYPVEQVIHGREIYAAQCSSCHGPAGGGNPAAGIPALDGSMHAWHHPDSQIASFLRNGVGAMPPVGASFSDDEIDAVLAAVKQWWEPDQLAWQTEASRQNP